MKEDAVVASITVFRSSKLPFRKPILPPVSPQKVSKPEEEKKKLMTAGTPLQPVNLPQDSRKEVVKRFEALFSLT